ncbi:hydrogenase nickel incorporation protein HypB [Mariprofundus ferrooxydans]|uniref:hydrogenase nickel incorporation protein HypB n=1 Tax=Mariprofundus ferrooxydans TaxID=314344 RepID=UPI0003625FE3|nr:hydrogenase nickel incorporation protein HypB [Mariprofundus ferrooxydans]
MCTTCGCAEGDTKIEGHTHEHGHDHHHSHDHHDHAEHGHNASHAPGLSHSRILRIEQDILSKNNAYAAENRRQFSRRGMLVLNLVSSPGSGKTTLLTRTLTDLKDDLPMAVIEGDQQTLLDAERIRATGASAVQINTGKGCHLDAHMVGHALEGLQTEDKSVLFIENVGNLVCPASFDLGEAHKVVILSVTEGEDKPLKYPDMFHAADLMLLNKTDLLPHLQFDVDQCIAYAQRVNPGIKVLQLSATTGEGMAQWYQWLQATRAVTLIGHTETAVGA